MAISKRLRFEILRRDNHACRYCGRIAPEVKLTVDHVTPEALGGTDESTNLVAACADCNAGKSSIAPNSELIADVQEHALRYASLVQAAYAILAKKIGERMEYEDEFIDAWEWGMIAVDWRISVGRWHQMGVPIEILLDAAHIACTKTFPPHSEVDRFKYFCGIVWNQIRAVDSVTRDKLTLIEELDGMFYTDEEINTIQCDSHAAGFQFAWNNINERYPDLAGWDGA